MFPNFLCIGAQKAGTTWLHRNLDYHPGVWMPPVKEIHYFNRSSSLPLLIQICHPKRIRMRGYVLRGLARRMRRVQKQPTLNHTHIPRTRKSKKAQNFQWYLRLLLLPRNDKWYASLFSPSAGRITGDITPYYAQLGSDRVAHIYALMPDAKIIYLLRNPIHRLWSHTAMHFSRDGFAGLATTGEEKIREFLEKQITSGISNYLENLQTWSVYPAQQFFVGFFDQLAQNPREFLRNIHHFLNLDTSENFIPQTVHEKRNVGQYPDIPDYFVHYLAKQYYEQIEQLHQRFNNQYTANWLQFARQHIE